MSNDRSVGPSGAPSGTLRFERLPYAHPVVQQLVEEVQAEYVVRYGGPDGTPMEDTMFDPPAGAFFVAFAADEEPVATGAWRARDDVEALGTTKTAEVKRMYVRASARRTGVARAVLAHLEETAAAAGAEVMVLETGTKQPEALQLYESAGYVAVPAFGYYRDSPTARHLAKRLTAAPPPGVTSGAGAAARR